MKKNKRLVFFDTNIPLLDPKCVLNKKYGDDHKAVTIDVIHELDGFKRGEDDINRNARAFITMLNSGSPSDMSKGGYDLGPGLGKLYVFIGRKSLHSILKNARLNPEKEDHQILNVIYQIKGKLEKSPVSDREYEDIVLVTNDGQLRFLASIFGITCEQYIYDEINGDALYTGETTITVPKKVIDAIAKDGRSQSFDGGEHNLKINQFVELRSEDGVSTILCIYKEGRMELINSSELTAYHVKPRNKEQKFLMHALLDPEIKIITVDGKAGTGKTILPLAAGLQQKKLYPEMLYTRQTIGLRNQDIGYTPGSVDDKLRPYVQGMIDNLYIIAEMANKKKDYMDALMKSGEIVLLPLNYIRGRSLSGKFFVVDESQLLTPGEFATSIERVGDGSKILFTGDNTSNDQIDTPFLNNQNNGFAKAVKSFAGNLSFYAHIKLRNCERSEVADAADLMRK